jgi:hypothetical protein
LRLIATRASDWIHSSFYKRPGLALGRFHLSIETFALGYCAVKLNEEPPLHSELVGRLSATFEMRVP